MNSALRIIAVVSIQINLHRPWRRRKAAVSTDEFLQVFDARIQSMANAHRLLSRSHWQGVSLAELDHKELALCAGKGCARVEGPEVVLSPEATQSLAIVLHELVTNKQCVGIGNATAIPGRGFAGMDQELPDHHHSLKPGWVWHRRDPQPHSLRTRGVTWLSIGRACAAE
jgi:hypothetical protein